MARGHAADPVEKLPLSMTIMIINSDKKELPLLHHFNKLRVATAATHDTVHCLLANKPCLNE